MHRSLLLQHIVCLFYRNVSFVRYVHLFWHLCICLFYRNIHVRVCKVISRVLPLSTCTSTNYVSCGCVCVCVWWMSHVAHMNEWWRIHVWVTSHLSTCASTNCGCCPQLCACDRVAPLRMGVRRAAAGSQVLPDFQVISCPWRATSADQGSLPGSLLGKRPREFSV